jgi:hypothetical protein
MGNRMSEALLIPKEKVSEEDFFKRINCFLDTD